MAENLLLGNRALHRGRNPGNEGVGGYLRAGEHRRVGSSEAVLSQRHMVQYGAVVAKQRAAADAVAVHNNAMAYRDALLDGQGRFPCITEALLDVDVVADDYGVFTVPADGDTRPDAGVFTDFHVSDHVCETR